MGHIQRGYIYEGNCAGQTYFYVRYNVTKIVDGQPKRVQVSERLVEKRASTLPEEAAEFMREEVANPPRPSNSKLNRSC